MFAELAAVGLLVSSVPAERTVPCAEVIQSVAFPHAGSRDYPAQQVLGHVSAPGRHVPQSTETGEPPWTHFSKWGIVVRGGPGATVIVTVPGSWRNRVAISWGNALHRFFHTLRFTRCGADRSRGHAYAGGFFLRRPRGCVPLRFTLGNRTRLVWFGIVQRCPSHPAATDAAPR
jgi:hypothetical protein